MSDGSYIDWFLPHLSFTITARDNRPWKKRDLGHLSLSQGGLFHDAKNQRTEKFTNVVIEKCDSGLVEGKHGHHPDAPLPSFKVKMWNEKTIISLRTVAVDRAHWTFEQPTRGGLTSHFTYNEYPLETKFLRIKDESGSRTEQDYTWIRGNAEHSWGLLH